MEEAAERWRVERRRLNAEIDKLESEVADAKARVAPKSATSGHDSKGAVIDPAALWKVQGLKRDKEGLQEAIRQKTQLANELQSVSAPLETERTRLVAAQALGRNGVDTAAIAAVASRVERKRSEVIAVIDNPDTALALLSGRM
jgi:hypothetical protein